MDFALKILGKYGWKEGEGLGKNSNGIAKPLKATLKFDNAGFGSDQAAVDFNNHWWERVFNEAASSVDVNQEGESIKMNLKSGEDGVEISTKGYSMKKLKNAKRQREKDTVNGYHNFLQAATLTNLGGEVENPNKIDASDIEVTKIKVLTDEELFKACGGRTAHKGARHGLKLNGKLSRIEQQEQELLEKMMAKRNEVEEAYKRYQEKHQEPVKKKKKSKSLEKLDATEETQEPVKKKKKSKRVDKLDETVNFQECENKLEQNNEIKKKNKRKHLKEDISEQTNDGQETEHYIKQKKKKKSKPEVDTETSTEQFAKEVLNKKKKNSPEQETEAFTEQPATEVATKKKKKKNREETVTSEETALKEDSNTVEIVSKKKKSKKKCKEQE